MDAGTHDTQAIDITAESVLLVIPCQVVDAINTALG